MSGRIGQELDQALFAAAEMAWLALAFMVLEAIGVHGPWPSAGWLACLYPPAYLVVRPMVVLGRPARPILIRAVVSGLIVVCGAGWLLSGRTIGWAAPGIGWRLALVLVGGGFVWLRGVTLARRQVDGAGFKIAFQVGLVALTLTALMAGPAGLNQAAVEYAVIAFFSLVLTGLALTRRREQAASLGARSVWSLVLPLAVGAILILALTARLVVDHDFIETLLGPVYWLGDRLAELIDWILSLLPNPKAEPIPEAMRRPPESLAREQALRRWFAQLPTKTFFEIMFHSCWAALVGAVLWRGLGDLLHWLNRRFALPTGLKIDKTSGGLLRELNLLVRWLLRRLAVLWRLAFGWRLGRGGGRAEALGLVFGQWLTWAGRRHRPRRPGETAREYLTDLAPGLGPARPEAELITGLYLAARFSPRRPEAGAVDRARAAYRRLKKIKPTPSRNNHGSTKG